MPATPDDINEVLKPRMRPAHTLSPSNRVEVAEQAVELAKPYLPHLPYAQLIEDMFRRCDSKTNSLGALVEPLTTKTRCLELFVAGRVPYQEYEEGDKVQHTMLLTVQGEWAMWNAWEKEECTRHTFEPIKPNELELLLGYDGSLLLGVLKCIEEASREGERRANRRARDFAILDHEMTRMMKLFGYIASNA
jgi:hypothetical protein